MKPSNRIRLRLEELEGRIVPATLSNSTNWSGYAVTTAAGAVTQVAGGWVVPAVTATSVNAYSSAWVGIDGYNSNSVEQLGTDSDYTNGAAHYYAWYEMYPNPSVNLSLTIKPGDAISASVTVTAPGQFTLSITDVTTPGTFSTVQSSSSAQQSSAEWIQEAPSSFSGVLPLANFGTINFSGANATVSGATGPADNAWSGSTLYQINMVTNTGTPKATTGPLTDSGTPSTSGFSVTWNSTGVSSGGGGKHHRSPDAPLPAPAQTISVPSVATASLASAQPVAPQLITPALSPAAVVPASTIPAAQPALTATLAYFGQDGADATAQQANDASGPAAPLPAGPATPAQRVMPSPTGERAEPSSAPTSAVDTEHAPVVAAISADNALGVFSDGQGEQGIALVGLALGLALDRSWVSAQRGKADERRRSVRPQL